MNFIKEEFIFFNHTNLKIVDFMDNNPDDFPPVTQSRQKKIRNCLIFAFLVGLGWHLRGSGTSDVSVVGAFLLLFLGGVFFPRKKFNFAIFGLIVLAIRVMRRGWGTFVGQAGIPGMYPAMLSSPTEGYSIEVAWWQGYFWLFIVGIAWSGLAALFLGGYFFSNKKYNIKDGIVFTLIYSGSALAMVFVARVLIPLIAPEAYYQVYLVVGSTRNYESMQDNLAFALAIIPVLLYILIIKKDRLFVERSMVIMLIFGLALSGAEIWQVIGRNNPLLGLPAWSLWEYFTGFIIGGLLLAFYYIIPARVWHASDENANKFSQDTSIQKFGHYLFGHVLLFVYGMIESLTGLLNSTSAALGFPLDISTLYVSILVLSIDLVLYLLYMRNKFGSTFRDKRFDEKNWILLFLYIIFAYTCYILQFFVNGSFWQLDIGNLVVWLDTGSVILVGVCIVFLLRKDSQPFL